jgi:hypothetical protein
MEHTPSRGRNAKPAGGALAIRDGRSGDGGVHFQHDGRARRRIGQAGPKDEAAADLGEGGERESRTGGQQGLAARGRSGLIGREHSREQEEFRVVGRHFGEHQLDS